VGGKSDMKRRIATILVSLLLFSNIVPIICNAGDEDNPEIEDTQDTAVFNHLDIISAWFYEKEEEPNYLFTALKINVISMFHLKQHLTIHWEHNGVECASSMNIGYGIPWIFYSAGYGHGLWFEENYEKIEGEYDSESGIIICKIPKNLINNPQKGDVLTKTKALTFQRFGFIGRLGFDRFFYSGIISLIFGKVPWDGAPEYYGEDYIIQY
jgi:hypothetical protein